MGRETKVFLIRQVNFGEKDRTIQDQLPENDPFSLTIEIYSNKKNIIIIMMIMIIMIIIKTTTVCHINTVDESNVYENMLSDHALLRHSNNLVQLICYDC